MKLKGLPELTPVQAAEAEQQALLMEHARERAEAAVFDAAFEDPEPLTCESCGRSLNPAAAVHVKVGGYELYDLCPECAQDNEMCTSCLCFSCVFVGSCVEAQCARCAKLVGQDQSPHVTRECDGYERDSTVTQRLRAAAQDHPDARV